MQSDLARVKLWSSMMAEASDQLLLGSGYLSDAVVEVGSARYNAHSAYLATFRDGGIIGLVFLIFEPRGLYRLWERFKAFYRIWPFSY